MLTPARLRGYTGEAGALGFTPARTLSHRTSRGEPTPTLTAGADELVGIARAIGATGRGVLQVVSDFADVEAEFGLCRRMAAESGRPLSCSVLQTVGDAWRHQLALLEAANAADVPITGQVAPRAVGLLLGLQCTLNPFMTNRVYREIAGRPLAERVAIMADPAFKQRVLEATVDESHHSTIAGTAPIAPARVKGRPMSRPTSRISNSAACVPLIAAFSNRRPLAATSAHRVPRSRSADR